MLDLALFKNPLFLLFIISNFLTSIGFNIPYVFIVSQAKSLSFTSTQAGMFLSVIGVANTIGRIILGYISDKPWVNRLYVYIACLTLCGVSLVASAFCTNFYTLAAAMAAYGFTIGAYVGLTSVILVDLLGLEKLTNAFGLVLLFQGFASLVGPPMGGALYDHLGSYGPAFHLAGITIGISGLILLAIPPIQKCMDRRQPSV